ncbi:MAG: YARHG domain-containing protein, partial [Brucellaceae bacterium]|nr:YARHG domain-containing protein [Brucellaceae bacterium]
MKTILSAAAILLAALVALLPAPAAAQSCYDLWYE